jgi:hypothetical protein
LAVAQGQGGAVLLVSQVVVAMACAIPHRAIESRGRMSS